MVSRDDLQRLSLDNDAPQGASDDGLGSCKWEDNSAEDGVWSTSCENMFVFEVDGPLENGMKFCPYCGKHLIAEPNAG